METGSLALEVFILLRGCVECKNSGKVFWEGTMFGETDIIFDRKRLETYISVTDCHVLRIRRPQFETILNEVDDFRIDVESMADQRE